jgi:hypothetical protein
MQQLRESLLGLVGEQKPMTVRQVFYRGVGFGLWQKSESDYKRVGRILTDMRRDGEMPYDWLADATRWMRKPRTFDSIEEALRTTADTYRRSLWHEQDKYIEVWLEKEALAGVVVEVTDPWDVPLMVARGYPSLSFLHSAAETMRYEARDKDVVVLYLGDHDPSGDDIARKVEEDLSEMSGCDIEFVRVAATERQIEEYDLPTRPAKRTDTRAAKWEGAASVEVDAIEPDTLRQLVHYEIESRADENSLELLELAEHEEREVARRIIEREFAS